MRPFTVVLFVLLLVWTTPGRPPLDAQVRPVYDLGAAGLTQVLQRLHTTASALHTGAHPDDEDSAFMARTARGDHARVAYLSLNRGEGGQNIIGTELFEALGVVRTEELLQARRLDGGEQFFTRTIDYGFSKTQAEASARWGQRDVLADMVRVIRMFRPLVVYSRFSGTPADGHGQHQLAGFLTPLAFDAAADPAEFPEQLAEGLRPWRARKLYVGAGFRADPSAPPTVQVDTGAVDPVIGRSYAEIAAEGRSQHKSQEMGTLELRGPSSSGLRLVRTLVPVQSEERTIFDGLDTSLRGLAALAGLPEGLLRAELEAMEAAVTRALREYAPLEPSRIVPVLADGLRATRAARSALARDATDAHAEADFLLAIKEDDFVEALTRAAGVVVDPLAEDEIVVPGTATSVAVRTFASDPSILRVVEVTLAAPPGWTVEPDPAGDDRSPVRRETPAHTAAFVVAVPAEAVPTQPYFLEQPREGDRYSWRADDPKALPFAPPLLAGVVSLEIGGLPVTVRRPVQYRFADRVRGELRRDVHVVPAVTVALESPLVMVPLHDSARRHAVAVGATSHAREPIAGTLRLRVPDGWDVTPREIPLALASRGDQASATFSVLPVTGGREGTFTLTAEAVVDGRAHALDLQTIAYPHIQTHRRYLPSSATVQVLDLQVAAVSVGYIMGSGDQVPDALRRMGVDLTIIDDERLARGDLSRFDTIVVGIRASEARPAFVAMHERIRQYVADGGTLIVQYQQTDYVARNLPPYPVQSPANSRVTDEAAPVRILGPDHPVFTFPNRITEADFDHWVQERNLYAFNTFDEQYVPLLESADPGEPPQRGGQVYARVGEGHYVYTSYAWFRQLPAGVPGAYRQFANLISLPRAP